MAKAAGRKRIYSSFSRALKGRGYIFEGDVALSSDKTVKVEFVGGEWYLYIDEKLVLVHPMESGSMKKLEHTLSVQGKKSSIKKVAGTQQKREGQDSLLPKLDRIEIRKINKQKGVAITADQKAFKQVKSKKEYKEQIENFFSQMKKIGFTSDADSQTWKREEHNIIIKSDTGTWKLFSYDRLLGEGVASLQSVEVIETIINEVL